MTNDINNDSPRDWQNTIAMITGAGSGVGAAVAAGMAAAGASLILIGRSEDKLQATAAAIKIASEKVLCIAGDLSNMNFCRAAVAQAIAHFGRLDVLVNNAGTITRSSAAQTSDDAWREVMQINCDAVFALSSAAAASMRGGAIVNVASTCALVGVNGLAAYCASKGAVVQLTRSMALECAPQQTTVNAVCPGAIDTPMLFSAHPPDRTDEQTREGNIAIIPHGRLATAAEVARAIIFLASEPHITGVMLPVDGGYTAQ